MNRTVGSKTVMVSVHQENKIETGTGESLDDCLEKEDELYLENNSHIREVLKENVDVNAHDSEGETAIYSVYKHYNRNICKRLFLLRPDVNLPNYDGMYPIHVASKSRLKDEIQDLCDHGAILTLSGKYKRSPLHFAASYNTEDVVEYFVDAGCEVEAVDINGNTAGHYAAMRYDGQKILEVLGLKGDTFKTRNKYGKLPLHYANSSNVISFFISMSQNLNIVDNENKTVLHYLSSSFFKRDQITLLLSKGVDVNICDRLGRNILITTCKESSSVIVELLLQNAKETNFQLHDIQGNTALHYACQRTDGLPIVKLLIESKAEIDVRNVYDKTPLVVAIEAQLSDKSQNWEDNRDDIVRYLVEVGADINCTTEQGSTPFHLVFKYSNISTVEWFLKHLKHIQPYKDASLSQFKDARKRTILHYAAENKNVCVFQRLVKIGIDVNIQDEDDKTALHYGRKYLDETAVASFVKCQKIANIPDKCGKTPFDVAVEEGNISLMIGLLKNLDKIAGNTKKYPMMPHKTLPYTDTALSNLQNIIKRMLTHNVPKNTKKERKNPLHKACETNNVDKVLDILQKENETQCVNEATEITKRTPLHIACEEGNRQITYILSVGGAKLNEKDIDGKTALHLSVEKNHHCIVLLLVHHGANINLQDKRGWTPLHISASNNQFNLTLILLQHGASCCICDAEGKEPESYTGNKKIISLIEQYRHGSSENCSQACRDVQEDNVILPPGNIYFLEMVKRYLTSNDYIYIPSEKGKKMIKCIKQKKSTADLLKMNFLVYTQNTTTDREDAPSHGMVNYACLYLIGNLSSITPEDIFQRCFDLRAVLGDIIEKYDLPVRSVDDSILQRRNQKIWNPYSQDGNGESLQTEQSDNFKTSKSRQKAFAAFRRKNFDSVPDLYVLFHEELCCGSIDKEVYREHRDQNRLIHGESPIHSCIERKNWHDTYDRLKKTTPNIQDGFGWTPLHHCILHNMDEFILLLVENNADINTQSTEILPFVVGLTRTSLVEEGVFKNMSPLLLATFLDRHDMIPVLTEQFLKKENLQMCLKLSFSDDTEMALLMGICRKLETKYSHISLRAYPGSLQSLPFERILLGLSREAFGTINETFLSLKIRIRNPNFYDENDKKTKNETVDFLTAEEGSLLEGAISEHAPRLWLCHSSLNIISGAVFQSGEDCKEKEKYQRARIVLYTTIKEFIPLQERMYPTKLNVGEVEIGVVLKEGNSIFGPSNGHSAAAACSKELRMGSGIGILNGKSGTMGPLVDLGDSIGFISCAHIFCEKDIKEKMFVNFEREIPNSYMPPIVQPTDDELKKMIGANCSNVRSLQYQSMKKMYMGSQADRFDDRTWRNCGEIIKAVFEPNRHVSVDAALIQITDRKPSDGRFTEVTNKSLQDADLKEMPVFNSGQKVDLRFPPKYGTPVIKVGASTEITRGRLVFDHTQVKVQKEDEIAFPPNSAYGNVGCGKHEVKFIMKNQYEVEPKKGMQFFDRGDSGAGVFILNESKGKCNDITCLGIAIGNYDNKNTIVSPINAVLSALDNKKLKEFRKRRHEDAFPN